MSKQPRRRKLYRNEQGQLVLYVAVTTVGDIAQLFVNVFLLDSESRKLERVVLTRHAIDLTKEPYTKAELVEAVRNLAQMYALQMGEPDFDIVSNPPLLDKQPIIKMKREKSNDIFKTF